MFVKKIITLAFVCVVGLTFLGGCKKVTNENENTTDITPTEGTNKEVLGEEVEEEDDDSFLPSPKFTTEIVSNKNKHTYTSTIDVNEDRVMSSYNIDQQLQQELENGGYTLEEPFIVLNPFQNSPLTAMVLFESQNEYAVRVTVHGNTDKTDVVGYVDKGTKHRVPIIGLYPDKENDVTIDLLDSNNKVVNTTTIKIQTDKLPANMENSVKVEQYTKTSAYGLLEVSGFGTKYPFAFDEEGNIRWYLEESFASYGYFPLSNDHFIVMDRDVMVQTYEKPHAQQLYEMDYLGRVSQIYFVEKGAHHEIIEMKPGGNLLVLTNSIDEHVEDVVEEIDRNTGAIVKSLDMREIFGDTYVDRLDWAHLNAASYSEKDNTVLLSPRNIHSGIKVDWSTNELIWILANPKVFEGTPFENKVLQPDGDIIWHYQPHSIYEISEDLDNDPNTIHIMMFDNHWDKARKVNFFDKLESSYVSLYTINEDTMKVTQPHIYEGIKSKITSNFLFNQEERRVFFMGGYLAKETKDERNGMIYEYDYDTEEVINQYSLRNTFYRAYEFEPNFNTSAVPLEIADNYFKGTLRALTLDENTATVPSEILEKGVNLSITNQLLYIKAKDHKVSKIELIGNNSSYSLDMSYTKEGEKKYHVLNYNLVVPFSNLVPDEYKVVVTFEKVRYNTGETITIQ